MCAGQNLTGNDSLVVRQGTEQDLPDALRLIIELAIYEKQPDAVLATVDSMREDGFGENPVFGFFVAEVAGEIVGISLYYDRYSTWRGRVLFLDDLIVTETSRGNGVGKALFDRTLKKARDEGYRGMAWQVLDWNEPAINFYRKYDAELEAGWLNCRLPVNRSEKSN